MRYLHPWSILEARVAIYAAWQDGMPMTTPGTGRHDQPALLTGLASIRIGQEFESIATAGHLASTPNQTTESGYSLSLTFLDGVTEDDLSRFRSRLIHGGFLIVTIVQVDEGTRTSWRKMQFFYASPTSEASEASAAARDDGLVFSRTLNLTAGWFQESTGTGLAPSLAPSVLGEVEWICGPHRIHCLTYDPETHTWSTEVENNIGIFGLPYIGMGEIAPGDPWFSLIVPRLNAENRMEWTPNIAFTVTGGTLTPSPDYLLQTNGTAEPLAMSPQSRVVDEPVAVFRYLRNIYASVGHSLICIPSISGDAPPATHEPHFRLGRLVLLPRGAFTLPA